MVNKIKFILILQCLISFVAFLVCFSITAVDMKINSVPSLVVPGTLSVTIENIGIDFSVINSELVKPLKGPGTESTLLSGCLGGVGLNNPSQGLLSDIELTDCTTGWYAALLGGVLAFSSMILAFNNIIADVNTISIAINTIVALGYTIAMVIACVKALLTKSSILDSTVAGLFEVGSPAVGGVVNPLTIDFEIGAELLLSCTVFAVLGSFLMVFSMCVTKV